jgi:hypothetical protein
LGVWVEEQKENHADGHEIHVDQEQNTAMVEAPTSLHATDGVDGAGDGEEGWKDEIGIWPDSGKAGDCERDAETEKNQKATAEQRPLARIKDGRLHIRYL